VVDLEMLIPDKYFGMKLQSLTVVLVVLGVMVVVIQMHQMSQQDYTLLMIQTTTWTVEEEMVLLGEHL
jgi:hypothetical protein